MLIPVVLKVIMYVLAEFANYDLKLDFIA